MSGYGVRTLTAESRLKARWIPEGSERIDDPNGLGVVYVYTRGNTLCALAYKGTAQKSSWHFQMKDREQAQRKAEEFFANLKSWKDQRAQWAAERNKPHTIKVGDIVTNSWGYDQTNVDAYQVTRTTEHFVFLRPIATTLAPNDGHAPMAGRVIPVRDAFAEQGEETQHKATCGQYGNSVCFEFGSGSVWDGKESLYCSWYA